METNPTAKQLRILVVEDDPSTQIFVAALLDQAGYQISKADNGEMALAALNTHRIDVVVTDLQMEGMDGHGLLDYMAEHLPLIPKIVLTGHTTMSTMLDCLREGALAFCSKPLHDGQELLEAVALAAQLQKHRHHQLQNLVRRNREQRGQSL